MKELNLSSVCSPTSVFVQSELDVANEQLLSLYILPKTFCVCN
jgi:hypothetical protein